MTSEPLSPALDDEGKSASGARRNPSPRTRRSIEQRANGGGGTHLSDAARDVVFAGIVRGDSNKMINFELVELGHLKKGQSLSQVSLTGYRKDPRARVEIARLSEESLKSAHNALSESLVTAVQMICVAKRELAAPPDQSDQSAECDAGLSSLSASDQSSFDTLYKAVARLWKRVGRGRLLESFLSAEEGLFDSLNQREDLSPEDRQALALDIEAKMLERLRRSLSLPNPSPGQPSNDTGFAPVPACLLTPCPDESPESGGSSLEHQTPLYRQIGASPGSATTGERTR